MTGRVAGIGFVAAFVAVQLFAPLEYYLLRRDPHDERFAWRMFSPTRSLQCQVAFTAGGEPVTLAREFHEAWIEIAERGRFVVIEAMGQRLCAKRPGEEVVVDLQCRRLDGEVDRFGGANLCRVPRL